MENAPKNHSGINRNSILIIKENCVCGQNDHRFKYISGEITPDKTLTVECNNCKKQLTTTSNKIVDIEPSDNVHKRKKHKSKNKRKIHQPDNSGQNVNKLRNGKNRVSSNGKRGAPPKENDDDGPKPEDALRQSHRAPGNYGQNQ